MLPYNTPSRGGGIYLIRLSDSHFYGGRAQSFRVRWEQHYKALAKGEHRNLYMQSVYNKYGRFEPVILERHKTHTARVAAEQSWLDEHHGTEGCVNLSPHATGGNIVDWTEEMRKRHSEALMGQVRSPESLQRQAESWHKNPENRRKARRSADRNRLPKGYRASEAHRKANAEARRGKRLPETTKATMRDSQKRRRERESAEDREAVNKKIGAAMRGRVTINNGSVTRMVWPEEAADLLSSGWSRGKAKRPD